MTSYERTTVGLTPSSTFTDKLKLSEGGAGLFVDEEGEGVLNYLITR